jgi:dipeptidyl aminopeptidase/acylaminoacyl peptidase/uncharacterized protein (DUF885 family)
MIRNQIITHRVSAVLFIAVLALVTNLAPAAQPSPTRERTINQRIAPHWTDANQFSFRRETISGKSESVVVDAVTGEINVQPKANTGKKDHSTDSGLRGGPIPHSGPSDDETEIQFTNATTQPVQIYWVDANGRRTAYGKIAPGESTRQHTFVDHAWEVIGDDGEFYGSLLAEPPPHRVKIEQTFERPKTIQPPRRQNNSRREEARNRDARHSFEIRIHDGKLQQRATNKQTPESDQWIDIAAVNETLKGNETLFRPEVSPDGKLVAVWKRTPGDRSEVFTITSSPPGGGRATLQQRAYALPGDRFDAFELVVVDTQSWKTLPTELPVIDFGSPNIRWRGEHELLIEKVDRGHQRYRLFTLDPIAQIVRTLIDEASETFIWTAHGPQLPPLTHLKNTDEAIYSSEKSGYRHLSLIDLSGEHGPTPITSGDFLVRSIVDIDEAKRELLLMVGEYHDDQDPYHRHLAKVNFDGSGFKILTHGDGDHDVQLSPDRTRAIVTYSRVDLPPVHELRSCETGELLATLATAERIVPDDTTAPLPTVFAAKGRDGKTDIWGMICFPPDYDPKSNQKYPVVENIYAGPHDSHVPKQYRSSAWYEDMTSLGFIVVRIDGMGTANRSKAFHDVCWHNLKDAGFPDRIAWMKAAAVEHPAMDLEHVGIYGTSAGGQNACGALLFHGDFYRAAVAACGCHDNRMDKASWNEQWMGVPVGKHYAASSNIDNAHRLQGDLLLLVGELDDNVPPESTYRLVDALIRADKRFDFLMIPGMGHSDGGEYGRKLTREFFVEKLQSQSHTKKDSTKNDVVNARNHQHPNTRKTTGLNKTQRPQAGPPDLYKNGSDPLLVQALGEEKHLALKEPFWRLANQRYDADYQLLLRRLPLKTSPERTVQLQRFFEAWRAKLEVMTDTTDDQDKAARMMLVAQITGDREQFSRERILAEQLNQRYPFIATITDICDWQHRGKSQDWNAISKKLERIENELPSVLEVPPVSLPLLNELVAQLELWQTFYADYHPEFDWWVNDSATRISKRLNDLLKTTKEFHEPPALTAVADRNLPLVPATDGLSPVMFGTGYPDLTSYAETATRFMPACLKNHSLVLRAIEREMKEKAEDLPAQLREYWLARIKLFEQYEPQGLAFEAWQRSDQVDYHLLMAEMKYRAERADLETRDEALISRAADGSGIEGRVAGRERLLIELGREFIADTPEELLELAQTEYEQCRHEMVQTSREMGFGDDWQAAVEKIKTLHVAPGEQPELIRRTADESVQWLLDRDLLTIDRLAQTSWRMEMMSPERQKVNPFFTGGELISVSFPTSGMTNDEKRQSLRGNNLPFVRATVHHELIPGHHLQAFHAQRYETHRDGFGTPFWLEGWALYWEFLLEENGFTRTPEERMGFLVWRAHRYARILFSLRFHLGQMSPDQCVNFLVDNVGFDRLGAEAEVRRSVGPDYPPLYQAAYMLGAMQLRQLAARWTSERRGTLKEFHDQILSQGSIPIALVEPLLWTDPTRDPPLTRQTPPQWKFQKPVTETP